MSQTPFQEFAGRMMHPDSEFIPKILDCMISEDQMKLLLALPGSAEAMAERTGRPAQEVQADLDDMFRKGLAFKKKKEGVVNWRGPMHIAQFHDASILWPEAPPEFYDLWQQYMDREWPNLAPMLSGFLPRPITRVVPVGRSIETGKTQVLAPENIRELIDNATRIAVTKCTCRITMRKCDAPVEVCLQINKGADYTVERGSGREITKEEAHAIVKKVQEAGLIHVTMNNTRAGHFICNCCSCCCQAFSQLIAQDVKLCDPSRYRPETNADLCKGCATCEERCLFGAIKVGDNEISAVSAGKCLGCGQCSIGCPNEALTMVEVRKPDFIPA